MRQLPPLNALRAFEAVARLSSVTGAAAELRVSHSAVSQKLRQLEAWFGQRLFARPGRRIVPTPSALLLAQDARAAFDRIARSAEQLERHGRPQVIVVNATPSLAMRWLIPKSAEFSLAHPDIELRITTSATDDIAGLSDEHDLIIRRDAMTRPGFICRKLLDDVSVPVLAPKLLERHRPVTPSDLLALPILHMRSRPDAWPRWLARQGIEVPERWATIGGHWFDHFFLSLQAAINGLGVAVGPQVLVEDDLKTGRLVNPFPDFPLESPGFHILYRQSLARKSAGGTVLEWLSTITSARLI
jgi:LysR family glycine cleavage system transcriptional activator